MGWAGSNMVPVGRGGWGGGVCKISFLKKKYRSI